MQHGDEGAVLGGDGDIVAGQGAAAGDLAGGGEDFAAGYPFYERHGGLDGD